MAPKEEESIHRIWNRKPEKKSRHQKKETHARMDGPMLEKKKRAISSSIETLVGAK